MNQGEDKAKAPGYSCTEQDLFPSCTQANRLKDGDNGFPCGNQGRNTAVKKIEKRLKKG